MKELTDVSLGTVTNGTSVYITDYRAVSGVSIDGNATGASTEVLGSGNYTVTNNVVYNGGLAVQITPSADPRYSGTSWNITATGQKTTYSDSSGARSMATLIVILSAMALVAVAASYAVKNYK